jgi:hypothetical protein
MMNSRLEDLMYRAGLTAQGCWDSMDDYDRKAIEKFADLIIQDCLLALEPDSMAPAIDYDVEEKFYRRSAKKIRQHFGVGE